MVWLVIGVLLWAYSHLMKRVTPGLRARLGEGPGKGLVTILSFLSIWAMVQGYRTAGLVPLWQPPEGLRVVSLALMALAVVLVTLGFSRGVMRTWLRHPMLTSVIVWAVAHLMMRGDLASLVLFGGIGLWALVDMTAINRMQPEWQRPAKGPVVNDAIHLAISAVVLGAIAWLHGWLGVPVLG